MARQREVLDGLTFDMSGKTEPASPSDVSPKVGNIYRSMNGPQAYWWIVGLTTTQYGGDFAIYLIFSIQGKLVGTGRVGQHVLKLRPLVGYCEFPSLKPEWY